MNEKKIRQTNEINVLTCSWRVESQLLYLELCVLRQVSSLPEPHFFYSLSEAEPYVFHGVVRTSIATESVLDPSSYLWQCTETQSFFILEDHIVFSYNFSLVYICFLYVHRKKKHNASKCTASYSHPQSEALSFFKILAVKLFPYH